MAKVTLTVRVSPAHKVWVERRAKSMGTTEAWIVEKTIENMAGDEMRRSFGDEKPERRGK